MARMIELIRQSAAPANVMRTAAKGALAVPADEMIEILVYLSSHALFGEQARMTLASWEEKSATAVAANPATPWEVLEYMIAPENLRPKLVPALLENPTVREARLQDLAHDDAFLTHLDLVASRLRDYVASSKTWYQRQFGPPLRPLAAYFSLEFGLTESLPICSGGLGILAGDHLKSASDLGVPLIGVGLLYQKGYFRQYLTSDGWQQERYPSNDFSVLPLRPLYAADGTPVRVPVELAGRRLAIRPWRVQVGRVTLLLLDTNIPENPPDLRDITGALYGGGSDAGGRPPAGAPATTPRPGSPRFAATHACRPIPRPILGRDNCRTACACRSRSTTAGECRW